MQGEYTVEQTAPGRYECNFTGEPKNMRKIIFAKDKKIATKLFLDYITAAERAGKR